MEWKEWKRKCSTHQGIVVLILVILIITAWVLYDFPLVGKISEVALSILFVFGVISFVVALSLVAKMKYSTNQGIGFIILVILIMSLGALYVFPQVGKSSEVALSILLVFGVISFVVALSLVAFIFNLLKLTDKTQALGLPDGSIRSMIALSLILIFMMSSLFLYNQVSRGERQVTYTDISQEQINNFPKEDILSIRRVSGNETLGNETLFDVVVRVKTSEASEDIAKQIITTMSTLVVAVAGFYFGSKTLPGAGAKPTTPLIRRIDPLTNESKGRDEDCDFNIFGKNLENPKEVKLVRNSNEIKCTDITSNAEKIKCKLKIPKDAKEGKWTLVVINSDNEEDRLEDAFDVLITV